MAMNAQERYDIWVKIGGGAPFNQGQFEAYLSKFDTSIECARTRCKSGKESDGECVCISASGKDGHLDAVERPSVPFYIDSYMDSREEGINSKEGGDKRRTVYSYGIPILSKNFFKNLDRDHDGFISSDELVISKQPKPDRNPSGGRGGDHYERGIDPPRRGDRP